MFPCTYDLTSTQSHCHSLHLLLKLGTSATQITRTQASSRARQLSSAPGPCQSADGAGVETGIGAVIGTANGALIATANETETETGTNIVMVTELDPYGTAPAETGMSSVAEAARHSVLAGISSRMGQEALQNLLPGDWQCREGLLFDLPTNRWCSAATGLQSLAAERLSRLAAGQRSSIRRCSFEGEAEASAAEDGCLARQAEWYRSQA